MPRIQSKVWSPIGYAGRVAAALPLQRLSALAVSTVSVQTKMEEGQKIVDKFAETAAEGKQAKLKKMHLGSIKIRFLVLCPLPIHLECQSLNQPMLLQAEGHKQDPPEEAVCQGTDEGMHACVVSARPGAAGRN